MSVTLVGFVVFQCQNSLNHVSSYDAMIVVMKQHVTYESSCIAK